MTCPYFNNKKEKSSKPWKEYVQSTFLDWAFGCDCVGAGAIPKPNCVLVQGIKQNVSANFSGSVDVETRKRRAKPRRKYRTFWGTCLCFRSKKTKHTEKSVESSCGHGHFVSLCSLGLNQLDSTACMPMARVTHPRPHSTLRTHVHRGTQLAPQHSNIFALFYDNCLAFPHPRFPYLSVAMALSWTDITDDEMWSVEERFCWSKATG